jgi:DNA-binding XRE family transcriptional regulator
MKRITRDRRLAPEEAAKYKAVRGQVARELPELIARHHERMESLDQLHDLLGRLKAAREAKGLSLADMTRITGMDRSALSKLETGQRSNPTVETLVRCGGGGEAAGGVAEGCLNHGLSRQEAIAI